MAPPGHGLCGEELQLIVIQAEATECEQAGERLRCQVVQGAVAEAKPFDVLQALDEKLHCCSIMFLRAHLSVSDYLEGHVGDVNQMVAAERQHVEEAELHEGSRLDLLDTIMIQVQLLQGGEAIKGLL